MSRRNYMCMALLKVEVSQFNWTSSRAGEVCGYQKILCAMKWSQNSTAGHGEGSSEVFKQEK